MSSINVMIVDDSAVVRSTLTDLISKESDINLLCTAADPYIAAKKLKEMVPDVIILDIEMPRMDGLTFLKKLMLQHPIPVIICSSKSEDGSANALRALEYGAVDIIKKPQMGTKVFLEESRNIICDAIRAAAQSSPKKVSKQIVAQPKLSADVIMSKPTNFHSIDTTEKLIVVGASTGGTVALKIFLESLPIDTPGVVIVQHMPENFTAAFAKRLNESCVIQVKEAENNDSVLRGTALIAPGNKHTLLKRSGSRYYVEIKDGPLVSRHRPSVDVLFRSTARYAGKNAIGVIMTGMGDDGAEGLLEMKSAGSYTVAQDEASCVVFGMPKEAIKRDAHCSIMSLERIAGHILSKV
ncbi:chemotaxis response regulator protein-glutamate methylesterase [Thiospirochaeta perfilievii]|uniref:Protein-glutamate methylesterase/protein-glutamine glutaminase n=1 Tax=Thiospirochaeta perfilievii TaxID=252967 RepID=A0A5C1QCS0_9SPIO|nr:chemotaxis response regulator protein-glutamate methylesterase [Thiospirochaeta perfilievii]QEN03992.1 chemotaxis response regulator protein-glutamate methylesterase [Thiospirochaeta perfilievii]